MSDVVPFGTTFLPYFELKFHLKRHFPSYISGKRQYTTFANSENNETPSCKVCPLSAISRRSFSNFNTRYLIPNDYFSHAECNISFQTIPNAQFPSKRSIKSYGKNFLFNFQTIVTAKKMVFNRDHKSPLLLDFVECVCDGVLALSLVPDPGAAVLTFIHYFNLHFIHYSLLHSL